MERFDARPEKSRGAISWGGWGVWDAVPDAWAVSPTMTPEQAKSQAESWNRLARKQAEKAQEAADLAAFQAYEKGRR